MPMHFFRILQMLTSFLENIGAGKHDLLASEGEIPSAISISAIISIYE